MVIVRSAAAGAKFEAVWLWFDLNGGWSTSSLDVRRYVDFSKDHMFHQLPRQIRTQTELVEPAAEMLPQPVADRGDFGIDIRRGQLLFSDQDFGQLS